MTPVHAPGDWPADRASHSMSTLGKGVVPSVGGSRRPGLLTSLLGMACSVTPEDRPLLEFSTWPSGWWCLGHMERGQGGTVLSCVLPETSREATPQHSPVHRARVLCRTPSLSLLPQHSRDCSVWVVCFQRAREERVRCWSPHPCHSTVHTHNRRPPYPKILQLGCVHQNHNVLKAHSLECRHRE